MKGDRNSKFFHSEVNWRRKKNALRGLNICGVWVKEPKIVKEDTKKFFEERFTEGGGRRPKLDGVKFNTIDDHDNASLSGTFEEEEVKEAV